MMRRSVTWFDKRWSLVVVGLHFFCCRVFITIQEKRCVWYCCVHISEISQKQKHLKKKNIYILVYYAFIFFFHFSSFYKRGGQTWLKILVVLVVVLVVLAVAQVRTVDVRPLGPRDGACETQEGHPLAGCFRCLGVVALILLVVASEVHLF